MNAILSMPMSARLAVLFALGACIGAAANWAIYALAWNRRPISPWSPPDPSAPRRRATDRLPIVGWLGLRREADLFGRGFWIRPMVIELLAGVGCAALYVWEIGCAGLLPDGVPQWFLADRMPALHAEFAAHVILIGLMLAASMIDADEMTIPDEITVVGTLVGLLIAAAWPESLLPVVAVNGLPVGPFFLHLASPIDWPAELAGAPNGYSLALGLACWLAWCVAILPRTWYRRHGRWRAWQLCCVRVCREPVTRRILRMAVIGSAVIVIVWYRGGLGWQGLLSALVGMAASGGLVWAFRVVGGAVLGREAMGFGDVTLMAMLGAFLGWQPCMIVFFLAPLAALLVGVVRLLLLRDREIPYGPFLCLAALFVVVRWETVWSHSKHVFALGWLVPVAVLCCPPLMAAMLGTWRLILRGFRR
jgi:leader peptidase (prepilin peptidase) / N-methyltransferase